MVDDFWMSNLEISWNHNELFLTRRIDHSGSPKGSIELDIDGVSGATVPYMNLNKAGYPAVNITQYAASQFVNGSQRKPGIIIVCQPRLNGNMPAGPGTKQPTHLETKTMNFINTAGIKKTVVGNLKKAD